MNTKKILIYVVIFCAVLGSILFFVSKDTQEIIVGELDTQTVFEYPNNLTSRITEEEGGKNILLSDPVKGVVIQVFSTLVGEDATITPNIVKADIPDIEGFDFKLVDIDSGIQGTLFYTKSGSVDVGNIWFVYQKRLFQISFYIDFENDAFLVAKSLIKN